MMEPRLERWMPMWPQALISALGIAVMAVMFGVMYALTIGLGEAQPIAFSHRFHVSTKQLSCVFCHHQALTTARAGIPSVSTCMLCHERIIVAHPQIAVLTDYYNRREPVPWVRVNKVRDFVFFNHQRHVQAGFDCSRCHGNVAQMDRVVAPVNLNRMGFCVQCHRDENYSRDCLICHR